MEKQSQLSECVIPGPSTLCSTHQFMAVKQQGKEEQKQQNRIKQLINISILFIMPVRTLRIEKTTSKEPFDFELWVEKGVYVARTVLSMSEQMPGL